MSFMMAAAASPDPNSVRHPRIRPLRLPRPNAEVLVQVQTVAPLVGDDRVIADVASRIREKCASSLRSDGATVGDQLCVAFPKVHKGRPNGPAAATAVASGACLASAVYKHSSAPNGVGGWRMVMKTRQANGIWFVHSEFAHQFDRARFAAGRPRGRKRGNPFSCGFRDWVKGGEGMTE
jgi:hypothetical protein